MALVVGLTVLLACGESPKPGEGGSLFVPGEADWITAGKEVAQATQAALSAQLIETIKNQGPAAAIDYCNAAAYPITDSLATANKATIRRTSLKFRNPANAPNGAEAAVLNAFAEAKANGDKLGPKVDMEGDKVHFYAPILLKGVCTNCHGTPGKHIPEAVSERLAALYPDDRATGYQINDLRGMWHITFDRNNN